MISGKKISKKKKRRKTHVLLENNRPARMSGQKKKKNPTELPKPKRNIWDGVYIMNKIPLWLKASLPIVSNGFLPW